MNRKNAIIDELNISQGSISLLWQSWGIKPDVVMGHSVGEYVAATVAKDKNVKSISVYLTKNFFILTFARSSFVNPIKLFRENKVDKSHILKVLYIPLVSLSASPYRIYDKIKFSSKIHEQNIEHPPIFIIGHWRSGTTYPHRLMSLNKNLGYMNSFQAFNPEFFLSSEKLLEFISKPLWISKRPMDNMSYSPNVPEEEEFALANISNDSFYHGWFFPKNMLNYFNKYELFEGVDEKEVTKYKEKYMEITK